MVKKIILWGLGSLLILLLALVWIAPALIDSSFLKQKIQAGFIQQNIGEIDYQKSSLSLIPRPRLSIEKIRYFLPERAVGRVEKMTVYPELLPLFRGRMRISKIVMDRPELTTFFFDEHEIKEDTGKAPVPFNLADSLAEAIAPLTAYSSDLTVSIRQGDINVTRDGRQEILIKDFDLDAGLIVTAPRFFNTRLNIARALLTVTREDRKTAIHCDRLLAALHVEKDQVRVTLSELNLEQPGMQVSGHFIAAPDTSGFILDLRGKDLDATAIRAAALDLGGDNEIVGDIFSYVKGGRIPEIRVQSKSKTISALGDLDNMVIQGRMQNGEISIEDIGMQLAEVAGDVLVSKGLLEVFESNARLGETTGHDGSLKIGLADDNDTFHLDVMLNARLREVPSVLQHIMDHEAFTDELSLIRNLKGTGKARLVIGERLDEMKTEIDILETDFSADYERVPFPIKLSRGKLFITENSVHAEGLHGSVGNSVFTEIFCDIEWEDRIDIDIPAGRLNLDLGELYPWISSFTIVQEDLADIKEIRGRLELSAVTLVSPPYDATDPSDHWRLSAAGEVKKVAIHTTRLPETLHLSSGHIQAAPNRLSFQKLNAQLMDAHGDLTGTLQGDISRPDHVKVRINGKLGEKAIRFLTQSGRLPAVYAVHGPVKFVDTDITWQSADNFSFTGNIFFPEGAKLFSDVAYQADGLQINRLDIKDQRSEATLGLDLKKNRIKLLFNGYLDNDTLDRIFIDEKMAGGWLKGDFEAVFVKGRLSESSVKGELQGGNLVVPKTEGSPLIIDKFLFAAGNNGIDVNQLLLSYLENQVAINGRVDMTADAFLLDLDASAKDLKWDFSEEAAAEPAAVSTNNSGIGLWEYPVTGMINLAAESFSLGEYTWKPVYAQISKGQGSIKVEVIEANLCGIDTPGLLQVDGNTLDLDFQCTAKDLDIFPTRACLTNNQVEMTGLFELTGHIKARGRADSLLSSVTGAFDFKARKGQITKDKKLSRILEVVNFTEIVKGRIPDLSTKGFRYDTIDIEGEFSGDIMIFKKLYMDGKTLDLLGKGTLDLKQMTLDVELLAAPFRTVDTAIKFVPGVNYLMAGNLISIPVRVRGNAADPVVSIMSASDISSNFRDFVERTIKSPIKLIENLNLYKKD